MLRVDLDGITLDDEDGRTTAILRYRTTRGIVVALPESVEVTLPWEDLDGAEVDLVTGHVRLHIKPAARVKHRWLGTAQTLSGKWTDRELLHEPPRKPRP